MNLAGANAGSARPSAADGESERGRSEGTSREDGRASRAGEGGNAAAEGKTRWSAQLGLNWSGNVVENMSTVVLGFDTHLLNILPDDKERSEMGVERGWLKLRENFYGGEQFCSGTTSRRLELCGRSRVALVPKLLSAPPEKLRCRQFTGTTRRDYSRPSGCLVREPLRATQLRTSPEQANSRL